MEDLNDPLDPQNEEPEIGRIWSFAGKPLNPFSRRRRNAFERLGFRWWEPDEGRESFLEKASAHVLILAMADTEVDALRGSRIEPFYTKLADWQEANDVDMNTENGREVCRIFNEQWIDFMKSKEVIATAEKSDTPAAPVSGNV